MKWYFAAFVILALLDVPAGGCFGGGGGAPRPRPNPPVAPIADPETTAEPEADAAGADAAGVDAPEAGAVEADG